MSITTTHDQIRASRVEGTDVYNREGEHIGAVDDIVIDKASGQARYAVMSFGGFLGIGEEYHPLPWDGLTYDTAKGGYVADVSREQLEGAPRFKREAEPNWEDPDWNKRVLHHYGYPLPPA